MRGLPIIVGVIGAALVVDRLFSRDSNPVAPPVTPATPFVGDHYFRLSCLDPKSQCSETESRAALYSYLEAVYGSLEGFPLQGELKDHHRREIEAEFPFLTGSTFSFSRADEFIRQARQARLKEMERSRESLLGPERVLQRSRLLVCRTGEVPLGVRRFSNAEYGAAVLLTGPRYCVNEIADLYLSSGLEREVGGNPEAWNIFIQATSPQDDWMLKNIAHNFPDLNELVREAPEEKLFRRIATGLGRKPVDPVLPMNDNRVTEEVRRRHPEISRMDEAVMSVAVLLEMGMRSHEPFDRNQYFTTVARDFGVDVESLRLEWYRRSGTEINEISNREIQVATDLSAASLREFLKANPRRNNLFLLNQNYYTLVSQVFGDSSPPATSAR